MNEKTCSQCGGTGYSLKMVCLKCNGTGKYYVLPKYESRYNAIEPTSSFDNSFWGLEKENDVLYANVDLRASNIQSIQNKLLWDPVEPADYNFGYAKYENKDTISDYNFSPNTFFKANHYDNYKPNAITDHYMRNDYNNILSNINRNVLDETYQITANEKSNIKYDFNPLCISDYFKTSDTLSGFSTTQEVKLNNIDLTNLKDELRRELIPTLKKEILEAFKEQEHINIVADPNKADPNNNIILRTLDKLCPSAANSFHQGLLDLSDTKRKSWRGTASEFRESLRDVIDKLAEDDVVVSQPDFKYEKDMRKPTMKQKVTFILKHHKKSGAAIRTNESAVETVEEKMGLLVRSVYERSSASAHTHTSKKEVTSIKKFVELVLSELLEIGDY